MKWTGECANTPGPGQLAKGVDVAKSSRFSWLPSNVDEYRLWWAENTDVPYGLCWCGCGQKTALAYHQDKSRPWFANEPKQYRREHTRFARGAVAFNAEDYRRWWQEATDIPYGLCWCGCGQRTNLATFSETNRLYCKGEPMRYLPGHRDSATDISGPRNASEYREFWRTEHPDIPYGFCCCGCGHKTTVSKRSDFKGGQFKGEPRLYLQGHGHRLQTPEYVEDPVSGCWLWQHGQMAGYGAKQQGNTARRAHAVYYEHYRGPVPKGKQLHHLCETPLCVNPAHLQPLTIKEHTRHHSSKLDVATVRRIRKRHADGERQVRLVEEFQMSASAISAIVNYKTWRGI